HAGELPGIVVAEMQAVLASGDYAGARDQAWSGAVVGIFVAYEQAFRECLAARKALGGAAQHAARGVSLQGDCDERQPGVIEAGEGDEPTVRVVAVARIGFAAARA
ncbi:hypothetical protein RZS08_45785, partial [Arthrospira platensis SPKY1]|nr:hypothetical protein [Arthrospira platensis SPKY1]